MAPVKPFTEWLAVANERVNTDDARCIQARLRMGNMSLQSQQAAVSELRTFTWLGDVVITASPLHL